MAISKVVYHTSSSDTTGTTWMDVTPDTVTASTLLSGETATAADGVQVTGTYVPSATPNLQAKTATPAEYAQSITPDTYPRYTLFAANTTATVSSIYLNFTGTGLWPSAAMGTSYFTPFKLGGKIQYTKSGASAVIIIDETVTYYTKGSFGAQAITYTKEGEAESPSYVQLYRTDPTSTWTIRLVFSSNAGSATVIQDIVVIQDLEITTLAKLDTSDADSTMTISLDTSDLEIGDSCCLNGYLNGQTALAQYESFTWDGQTHTFTINSCTVQITATQMIASGLQTSGVSQYLFLFKKAQHEVVYGGLSQVTVNAIPSQYVVPSGTISITTNANDIDVSQYAEADVLVEPALTTKTVTPTTEKQIVVKEDEYYNKTAEYNGTAESHTSGTSSLGLNVYVSLNADTKYRFVGEARAIDSNGDALETYDIDAVITWDTTYHSIATLDSTSYFSDIMLKRSSNTVGKLALYYQKTETYGFAMSLKVYAITEAYYGLKSVTVNPIPSQYVVPSGTKSITENGTGIDVTSYASVDVSVSGGYDETLVKNYISRSSNFTDIDWPDGLTTIGTYAFASCLVFCPSSLPSGLTSIGNNAFYNCVQLALTSLPSGVTSIGDYAFYNCTKLALASLPSGITSIGFNAFYCCPNLTLTSLPSGLTSISGRAFYYCSNLALTSLPSGVTSIGDYAFYNCAKLALTSLPSGLTSIGSYAFQYCTSLTTVECLGAITTLGTGAFNGNSSYEMSLSSVSFPNMSVSALSNVFGNNTAANACNQLAFADIGSTSAITSAYAFANCYALQTLVLRRSNGICSLSNVTAFQNTPMSGYNSLTGTVYVPSALISTYQTATNWSTLYNGGTVTFEAIEGSEYELD